MNFHFYDALGWKTIKKNFYHHFHLPLSFSSRTYFGIPARFRRSFSSSSPFSLRKANSPYLSHSLPFCSHRAGIAQANIYKHTHQAQSCTHPYRKCVCSLKYAWNSIKHNFYVSFCWPCGVCVCVRVRTTNTRRAWLPQTHASTE